MTKRNVEIAIYALFIVVIMLLPLVLDSFWVNRLAKYLVFGMLGIAVALSWGYAGILNLGQGLFFGAGAYMLAMSLKLASQTSLQQGSDKPVPDFMLWNAEPGSQTDLCCINKASFLWIPFENQWFGVAMGIVLPVCVAAVLGIIMFRKRIAGVFISIITLALVLLVRLLIIDAQPLTNGFNGLTDLGWFKLFDFEFDPYLTQTYYLVACSLAVVLVLSRVLIETRAGLILQAIRDDENRVWYFGYDVAAYQNFVFCVSAAIAGFAGMLYTLVMEFASPTFLAVPISLSIVIWCAVGGRASLLGAALGAIVVTGVQGSLSESQAFIDTWMLVMGALFIIIVRFLPNGLISLIDIARGRRRRGRAATAAASVVTMERAEVARRQSAAR